MIGDNKGRKMNEDTITKMKEIMLNNPVIIKEIADGLSQDEALNFFICP